MAHLTQYTITGPPFLAMGQNANWGIVGSYGCHTPQWSVGGSSLGTAQSVWYSATANFTLNASAIGLTPGNDNCVGSVSVEVWQGCDPRITDGLHPMYCDAEISLYPDGAAQYESCQWFVETNMPIELTVVRWYVNDELKHTGPTFDYEHQSNQGFDLYMTAEAQNFGARNEHKWIPVGPQLTCNM